MIMTESPSNQFLFMVDVFSPNSPSVFHSVSASLSYTWPPSNLCFQFPIHPSYTLSSLQRHKYAQMFTALYFITLSMLA